MIHILEVFCVSTFGLLFYQVLIAPKFNKYLKIKQDKNKSKSKADKMAQVKFISDKPEEIEKFIQDYAEDLSDESVKRLVDRIEAIRNDRVINADNMLKTRFEALEVEDRIEEKPAKKSRR